MRARLGQPSRSRLAFLVLGIAAYVLTAFGRFVHQPYVRRHHVNDLGLADSIGNLGGIGVQMFLGLAVLNVTRRQSYHLATFYTAGCVLCEFTQPYLPKGAFGWMDVHGTGIGCLMSIALVAVVSRRAGSGAR